MSGLTEDHVAAIKAMMNGEGQTAVGDPRSAEDRAFGQKVEAKGYRYTHSNTLDDMRVDHYAKLDDLSVSAMVIEHDGRYFLIERVPDTQH